MPGVCYWKSLLMENSVHHADAVCLETSARYGASVRLGHFGALRGLCASWKLRCDTAGSPHLSNFGAPQKARCTLGSSVHPSTIFSLKDGREVHRVLRSAPKGTSDKISDQERSRRESDVHEGGARGDTLGVPPKRPERPGGVPATAPFPTRANLYRWLRMEEAGELAATEMPDRAARMHCAHGVFSQA